MQSLFLSFSFLKPTRSDQTDARELPVSDSKHVLNEIHPMRFVDDLDQRLTIQHRSISSVKQEQMTRNLADVKERCVRESWIEPDRPRSHWSDAPRGTIISVLESAPVRNQTMSSTTSSTNGTDSLDLSLQPSAIDSDRKNETFNTACLKSIITMTAACEPSGDFDSTLTSAAKHHEQQR